MGKVAQPLLLKHVVPGFHQSGIVGVDVPDIDPGAHAVGLERESQGADDIQVLLKQQPGLPVGVQPPGLLFRKTQTVEEHVHGLGVRNGQRGDAAAIQRRLLDNGNSRTIPGEFLQRFFQSRCLILGVAEKKPGEDRVAAFRGFGTEKGLHLFQQ